MKTKNDNETPARKKLEKHLRKLHPELSNEEVVGALNSLRRFVTVIGKIIVEPQAQISYKDMTIEGEVVPLRIATTDVRELQKVLKDGKQFSFETFRDFNKKVNKDGK